MLRRNLGHGRVIEGLELRWGLVSNILHALVALGRWRVSDGAEGPMHKWYDPRLFDLLSREEIMAQRATTSSGEVLPDARTCDELRATELDVRLFGSEPGAGPDCGGGDAAADGDQEVEEDVFCRWLERAEFTLGGLVARWWVRLAPSDEAEEKLHADELRKEHVEDTTVTLFEELKGVLGGRLTVRTLAGELLRAGVLSVPGAGAAADEREDLVERVLEELVGAANMFADTSAGAVAQGAATAATEEAESEAVAAFFTWPCSSFR